MQNDQQNEGKFDSELCDVGTLAFCFNSLNVGESKVFELILIACHKVDFSCERMFAGGITFIVGANCFLPNQINDIMLTQT